MKKILLILLFSSLNLWANGVYFSPNQDLIDIIIKQLDKAHTSIDIAIYTFNSEKIKNKLLNKLNQGVTLRMVVNHANRDRTKEFLIPLVYAGANIRYVSKINHHKFIIIDNRLLYNSSGNFSDSARQASYDENAITCNTNCKKLIKNFQDEFNFLFNHAKDLESAEYHQPLIPYTKPLANNVLFTSTNFIPKLQGKKLIFKRKQKKGNGSVANSLIMAIDNAQESIQVATGHFRSWPLYKALVRARKRGVKVTLISDSQEYLSAYRQKKETQKVKECVQQGKSEQECSKSGVHFSRLAAAHDINVIIKFYAIRWFFPKAPQMHSKYMIIDNKTVYTGSYNWSYNAEFNTFENIAILKNKKMVKKYLTNFNKLKSLNHSRYTNFKQKLKQLKKLPLFFTPMSLTIDEIDQLMTIYWEHCPRLYDNPLGTPSCITN